MKQLKVYLNLEDKSTGSVKCLYQRILDIEPDYPEIVDIFIESLKQIEMDVYEGEELAGDVQHELLIAQFGDTHDQHGNLHVLDSDDIAGHR